MSFFGAMINLDDRQHVRLHSLVAAGLPGWMRIAPTVRELEVQTRARLSADGVPAFMRIVPTIRDVLVRLGLGETVQVTRVGYSTPLLTARERF